MKKVLKIALAVVLVFVLAVLGYVGYLFIQYSRIADNTEIIPENNAEQEGVKAGGQYTAIIQNIGFGAYTADFTFFMDGGKQSRAKSKKSVEYCVNLAATTVEGFSTDFILFQEVDTDSTRSYHTDQRKMLTNHFKGYNSAFAVNYHSAYLAYPFNEPHGASNSGLLTLSRYKINSALRRSLPISTGISKFLDLDRCYSVSRIPVDNGKELVIYNVHLSAYGGNEEIRTAQITMLLNDMKAEYDKGNYCVCGGDFNHDFTGDSTQKLNGGELVDFGWAQPFPEDLIPDGISRCINYEAEEYAPTCRNCDVPYKPGNFTIIVDGFLVSDNVEVLGVKNISADFTYSDHNPVVLSFILKK